MTDEPQPSPVFPQYQPPTFPGVAQLSHPKQQKPLFKLINRMLRPRTKPRSSKMTKSARKKKKGEV